MPILRMEKRNTWADYYGNRKAFPIPMQRYFCWAAVMCVMCLLAKADECPVYCTCRENTGTVTCQTLLERTIPSDLPQWANTLIVRGYNITTLFKGSFSSNSTELQLVNLSLSGNHIQTIEANAFSGLTQLEMLDLSHNLLVSIATYAFSGLRNLKILELSGNQLKMMAIANLDDLNLEELVLTNNSIQTVMEEDVSSLYEHKQMQVFLALNPFKCNCELQSFYYWLKNSSQCRDVSRLLCSDPESKKGIPIEKLRTEDVDCTNTNLEAVSYVFLSIVLALIGVVFLMVLYLNREGIKRWVNNIREACRDQMEVYHYRYEQDSDPRLANVAV